MRLWKSATKHWFPVLLYVTFSLFFLVAAVISTSTYVAVIEAQDKIVFENPDSRIEALTNGSIHIVFSIDVSNPTKYDLTVNSIRADVGLYNGTPGPGWYLPIASAYTGPTSGISIGPRSTYTLLLDSIISDDETLAKLRGYMNYSALQGLDYDLESIPYSYETEFIAWIGDFEHDYLREFYLNDIVEIDIVYEDTPGTLGVTA